MNPVWQLTTPPDVRDATRSGKRCAFKRFVAIRQEAFKSLAAGTPDEESEAPAAATNHVYSRTVPKNTIIASSMRTLCFILLSASVFAPVQAQPANMQAIAQALGVGCEYCHVAERGSNTPEPKKDIARAMLAMTRDINVKIQAATSLPATQAVEVQCVTCHRGVP